MFINGIYYQEYAKLEYGRLLWRNPAYRERLLRHWRDPRHPHAGRFAEHEPEVAYILDSPKGFDAALDAELRQRNSSLRAVVKEIPSVFGSFFLKVPLQKDFLPSAACFCLSVLVPSNI